MTKLLTNVLYIGAVLFYLNLTSFVVGLNIAKVYNKWQIKQDVKYILDTPSLVARSK